MESRAPNARQGLHDIFEVLELSQRLLCVINLQHFCLMQIDFVWCKISLKIVERSHTDQLASSVVLKIDTASLKSFIISKG